MAKAGPEVRIRALKRTDGPVVQELVRQLGYTTSDTELAGRIDRVLGAADHLALVAEQGDAVVGVLHAFERPALEKPCEVVVQALVVDAALRAQGIGKALMDAAETWAAGKGTGSVVLHTRNARAFYARLGYDAVATSDLMRKTLTESRKQT